MTHTPKGGGEGVRGGGGFGSQWHAPRAAVISATSRQAKNLAPFSFSGIVAANGEASALLLPRRKQFCLRGELADVLNPTEVDEWFAIGF